MVLSLPWRLESELFAAITSNKSAEAISPILALQYAATAPKAWSQVFVKFFVVTMEESSWLSGPAQDDVRRWQARSS